MSDDDIDTTEGPTRRDYVKYGGAVIGGSLLAGCTGESEPGETSEATATQTTTAATEADAETTEPDASYTVRVDPLGEFTFERVPERYAANDLMSADIAHALGKSEMIAGPGDMDRWPTFFYDQLPNVSFGTDDALELFSESGYDQEVFYEADPDVNLIDPGMARNYMQFDDAEVEELAENTGPFVTPFNVYIFAEWQDEHPTTIYEVFEQMSRVFREEEKYEAFATLHDEFISDIRSQLPPEDERPAVAIINAASSPGDGEFYPSTIDTPGTAMKPYRDLELRDALADVETTDGTFDYETMLEIDPEVIAVAWQIAVPDEQFTENFVAPFENDSLGQQLQAVQNDRVIRGQHLAQGPVINLFQTEYVAKQYYPDVFGEWPDDGTVSEGERLFDRQRVADIINGDI
jgi:iron complex transport system substrate-binding protein